MNEQIAYVLDNFPGPTAGTEGQFWLLYKLMCSTGVPPRVFTLRESAFLSGEIPDRYECLGIGSLSALSSLRKAFLFARRLKGEGVRIAHLFLNDTSVLLPLFLWCFGIKVIVSRRDLGFWYTAAILRLLRFNRHFVSRVIANCGAVADVTWYKEHYPLNKISVVLNGCHKPENIEALNLRTRFNIEPQAIILGMVANLRPLKGIQDAIWAVATLKMLGVKTYLFVAGADVLTHGVSERKRLEQSALELNIADQIIFLGPVKSSWPLLKELDIFLSCSSSEGLSNSIVEAMAAGLAVVATSVGGTPSIIRHEHSGLLYAPGKLNDLVTCIMSYVKNPLWKEHIAEEAKAFAETQLSPEALLAAHERIYTQLLNINRAAHTQPITSIASE